ncbi:MAG: YfiR family protein, partial [Terriglobia bacterium]
DESEYRVKLAFLYNFAQFVEWPADAFRDPAAPLTICVAGQDPFEGEIGQGLRGRTAGGHLVEIRKLKRDENPRGCHMIFVRAGDRKLAGRLLADLRGSSTLTVGETKGFADLGGVINLVVEENKLRFEINLGAARQTRLKLSSKLLALAKIVDAAP